MNPSKFIRLPIWLFVFSIMLTSCISNDQPLQRGSNITETVLPSQTTNASVSLSPSQGNIQTSNSIVSKAQPPVSSPASSYLPTVEIPMGDAPVNCPGAAIPNDDNSIGGYPIRAFGAFRGDKAKLFVYTSIRNEYGYGLKLGWAIHKDFTESAIIKGGSLQGNNPLWFNNFDKPPFTVFSISKNTPPVLPLIGASTDYSYGFPSLIYIPRAGCYFLEANWSDGSWKVIFSAGI